MLEIQQHLQKKHIKNHDKNTIEFRYMDLSKQRDVKRFARQICEDFERVHILVNNAGIVGDIGHKVEIFMQYLILSVV